MFSCEVKPVKQQMLTQIMNGIINGNTLYKFRVTRNNTIPTTLDSVKTRTILQRPLAVTFRSHFTAPSSMAGLKHDYRDRILKNQRTKIQISSSNKNNSDLYTG